MLIYAGDGKDEPFYKCLGERAKTDMCGICGFWDPRGVSRPDRELLDRMTRTLAHRGPDDRGAFVDDRDAIGLGFCRLAILDLSPAGHQPMASGRDAFWIVFNGEVYNFVELRAELETQGYEFQSRTDTEVILQAYRAWGEGCIERFVGMFAFVIWDRERRRVFAARDRLGIKPFYYSTGGGRFAFASELKALIEIPGFDRTIDAAALRTFLQRGYISAPASIFRSVRALPPGCTLTWASGEPAPRINRYWRAETFYEPVQRHEDDAADELDELLRRAVSQHLISDVPLGAFLSGGLDSSLVVALMRHVTTTEVKTFTVGFEETGYDESRFASSVARHLGTTHTNLRVTTAAAKDAIQQLPLLYDEPFADSSQIPTYLLSKLTREHVTVALSGDGGDELFCGYSRYADIASWQRLWRIPSFARKLAAGALGALALPDRTGLAARGFALSTPLEFYDFYTSVWRPQEIATLAPELAHLPGEPAINGLPPEAPLLDQLMLLDLRGYLPNDILTKVDRASMAVGLEARVPLLDHRVVEFAMRLPLSLKRRGGMSKVLLRRVLQRYVPSKLVDRPKQGFAIPLDDWLRGDLKWLLDEYLGAERIARQGIFMPAEVGHAVRRFTNGECTHARVWSMLVFQMWVDQYGGPGAVAI